VSLWTELLNTPHELSTLDVKGVPTRVLRAGKGEPVVFLHGISGHLEAFIPTLSAHVAAGFEVHLIDMLGHGFTGKPDVDLTIERLARHALDYLEVQGLRTANFTGISLGGWVVGWLLIHHPERIRRATMVLAAGSPSPNMADIAELVSSSTAAAVLSDDREQTRKRLEQVIFNKHLVTEELIDVRYRIYQQPEFRARLPRVLAMTQLEMFEKYMLTADELHTVDKEVLVVWSEEDVYSTVMGAGHLVDNLPHNKLVVFADAGHWPPYERPADFARVNTAFLASGLDAVSAGTI
jgi:2-hydroxy-6-oxonona-2,4-dienedioate hydrolase